MAADSPAALELMDDIQFALDTVYSPTSSYVIARAVVEAVLANPDVVLRALGAEKWVAGSWIVPGPEGGD